MSSILSLKSLLESPEQVKLVAKGGKLYVPSKAFKDNAELTAHYEGEDSMLMVRYPEGDYDSISWPDFDQESLARALFDCREEGMIHDHSTVLLPDGREFTIDKGLIDDSGEPSEGLIPL